VIVSAIAGVTAICLVYTRRFEPARYVVALAIAAVLVGWALAQWPRILPGLNIRQAASSHDVLVAVIVAVIGGGAIVFPSLIWLFRLSLRGSFDDRSASEQPISVRTASDTHTVLTGRIAVATLVIGTGLLVFADAKAAHVVAIVSLLVFVVTGFLALVPALLPDEP
jgi:cytochrome d ubiquinol oxidase subunit II